MAPETFSHQLIMELKVGSHRLWKSIDFFPVNFKKLGGYLLGSGRYNYSRNISCGAILHMKSGMLVKFMIQENSTSAFSLKVREKLLNEILHATKRFLVVLQQANLYVAWKAFARGM